MAKKARTTPARATSTQDWSALQASVGCALPVLVYGVFYALLVRTLPKLVEPVFGNVLASLYVQNAAMGLLVAGWMARRLQLREGAFAKPLAESDDIDRVYSAGVRCVAVVGLWVALIPSLLPIIYPLADFIAYNYSPVLAPHVVYTVCLYPISLLSGCFIGSAVFASAAPGTKLPELDRHLAISRILVPLMWFLSSYVGAGLLDRFHLRSFVWLVIVSATSTMASLMVPLLNPSHLSKNQKVPWIISAVTILAIGHTLASNPHVQTDLASKFHKVIVDKNFTIVDRIESNTGFLSVIDDGPRDARFLRAGHSIIGGVYTYTNDSVFSGFYYHDAHRLANRTLQSSSRGLNIGYGIGVAVSTFHKFNIDMDIVEIDPVVIRLAQSYFKLIDSFEEEKLGMNGHHVNFFAMDGRKLLEDTSRGTYDFVVHDVFTGGSVPDALFTWETFAHIRRVMKPDGIVSLNFVGIVGSGAMQAVIITLYAVFPHVRCFVENPQASTESYAVTNFVFFASAEPFSFRQPTSTDFLSSDMRAYALVNIFKHELDISNARPAMPESDIDFTTTKDAYSIPETPKQIAQLITDSDRKLEAMMLDVAVAHWKIMREILPAHVWWSY